MTVPRHSLLAEHLVDLGKASLDLLTFLKGAGVDINSYLGLTPGPAPSPTPGEGSGDADEKLASAEEQVRETEFLASLPSWAQRLGLPDTGRLAVVVQSLGVVAAERLFTQLESGEPLTVGELRALFADDLEGFTAIAGLVVSVDGSISPDAQVRLIGGGVLMLVGLRLAGWTGWVSGLAGLALVLTSALRY